LKAGGNTDAAEAAFLDALAAADLPDAANDLALIWLERGEVERAAKALEDLLRRHPQYRTALFNLGLAYARLNRKEDALAAFRAFREAAALPSDRADAESWIRRLEGSKPK